MMKLKQFKMEGKVYSILYNKTGNEKLSKFLEKSIFTICIFVYILVLIFCFRKTNDVKVIKEKKKIDELFNKKEKKDISKLRICEEYQYDLSVLVPAYNAERYIKECIDSIINQKTKYSFEIVIIDDGSQDNTRRILQQYEKINNINIIYQKNRGVAHTRNKCIENALGKYVMFVDSDDILVEGVIEKTMSEIISNGADMVQGSFYKFNGDQKVNIILEEKTITNEYDILKIPGYPWGKIIRRDLFKKAFFPEGYSFEDTIIPYEILSQCQKVVVLQDILYGYRINDKGVTKNIVYEDKCVDTVLILNRILQEMHNNGESINYELYRFTLNCQFSYVTYFRINKMPIKMQKALFIEMCNIINKINMKLKPDENFITKNMEKSLKRQYFYLWKYTSILLNILK